MRIAIAQINTRPGDFEATSERIEQASYQAVDRGAELLLVPAAAMGGIAAIPAQESDMFMIDLISCVSDLAKRVACPVVLPVMLRVAEEARPIAFLLKDGSAEPVVRGSFAEKHSGSGPITFELAGTLLGVAFSRDDLDDLVDLDLGLRAILYFSTDAYCASDPATALGAAVAESRYCDDARASNAWLVGVGAVGGYGDQIFPGSSFVLSPDADLVACAPSFEEDLLVADVSDGIDSLAEPSLTPEVYYETLHLWRALTLGLRDAVQKAGQTEVALVLDGRLSSRVLLVLATEALGPTCVHALLSERDAERLEECRRMAKVLRVDTRRASERAWRVVAELAEGPRSASVLACGMVEAELAAWATELGAVVLSAADKTALLLGPDARVPSAAVLAPLGDVYRSEVLALARMRNTISPVITHVSFDEGDAFASDGFEGMSAEERVVAVDNVLIERLEWGRPIEELTGATGYSWAVVHKVLQMLEKGRFLHIARPLPLMVSSRTFEDEARPIDLAWSDHEPRADQLAMRDTLDALLESVAAAPTLSFGQKEDIGEVLEEHMDELREALSFLGELSQGGVLSAGASKKGGGEENPLARWANPFSEN